MKRTVRALAVLGTLVPLIAYAQSALKTTDYSTTLGTTSAACVPADASRKTLFIENPLGGTNNVCYCVGALCTPSCGAAGTSVLPPGAPDFWANGSAPGDAINCIASGATTPVTIRSQK